MDNSKEFIMASETAKKLVSNLNYTEIGELYGLYKQATIGNINIEKPNAIYFKENKKWEAWNNYKDIDKKTAEIKYIKLINNFIEKYS